MASDSGPKTKLPESKSNPRFASNPVTKAASHANPRSTIDTGDGTARDPLARLDHALRLKHQEMLERTPSFLNTLMRELAEDIIAFGLLKGFAATLWFFTCAGSFDEFPLVSNAPGQADVFTSVEGLMLIISGNLKLLLSIAFNFYSCLIGVYIIAQLLLEIWVQIM